MEDNIDKREAELLARLEAEREQRLAEKIAAGEIVSVPLCIVGGSEASARAQVEQAKADKLTELRARRRSARSGVRRKHWSSPALCSTAKPATLSGRRPRLDLPQGRMRPLGRPAVRRRSPAPPANEVVEEEARKSTAPAHRDLHLCSDPPMPG